MENKNLNFFCESYKHDINILNNLQILLIKNQINKEFTLDHSLHSYLEDPFVGKNYVSFNEENVSIYSNEELVQSLNDLIKDYNFLLEMFGKVNEERKVLRKYNITLLQKLFSLEIGAQSANEADFQHFLNKVLFLNQEFLKKNVVILEEKLSQTVFSQQAKNFEIADLKSQIEKLEKKLITSRESLKQYLVTGITDENIPITSIKNDCFQSVTALPIYEDGDVLIESNENEDVSKSQSIIKALGLKAPRIKKVNEKVKIQPDENKNNLNIMKNKKARTNTSIEKKSKNPVVIPSKKNPKNFLKKSSIDFGLNNDDFNEKNKKIERIKPKSKTLSMSMSTTDFSNVSRKPEPRKTFVKTDTSRISIKKDIKKP